MAMVLYPEVQRRAQDEIHKLTGDYRLPCLSDRDAMPYINQILLETMRWHPVLPAGELSPQTTSFELAGLKVIT